jgi:hypothetical protein
MKRISLTGLILGIFLIASGSSNAIAVPITIDPGAYEGHYWGSAGKGNGGEVKVFDLDPGKYYLAIGPGGNITRKYFLVNPDGTVSHSPSDVDSRDSLIFNGSSTLKFKTTAISFDPDQYLGPMHIAWVSTSNQGVPDNLVVVPANHYLVGISHHDNGSRMIYVDANGQVGPSSSDPKSSGAFIFNGDTVKLRNVTVRFDPQDYSGHYLMNWILPRTDEVQDVVFVPGFGYSVKLASLDAAARFWFEVNGDGTVGPYDSTNPGFLRLTNMVEIDNSSSPVALKFKTVTVNFDPEKYVGLYRLDLSQEVVGVWHTGPKSLQMIPDNDYAMQFGGSAEPWILYHVDADGNVGEAEGTAWPDRTDTFGYSGNTISFKTATLEIAPDENGLWGIYSVSGPSHGQVSGAQIVKVVSGVKHRLSDYFASPTSHIIFMKVAGCEDPPETVTGHMNFVITCLNDDITAPTITAPDDVSVEATGFLTAVDIGYAWAMDDVGPIMIVSDAPGAFPVGPTTVNWTTTDAAGNNASAPQAVTVVDTVAPVITAPSDVTVEATGPLTPVNLAEPEATDLVGVVSISNNAPAEGLPVSSSAVTWTATDGAGNSSSVAQTVTVVDTTAPSITAPADITEDASGPLTLVSLIEPVATDLIGVVSLTNDASADGFPAGSTTVVTWKAEDAAGNSATATHNVTINAPVDSTLDIRIAGQPKLTLVSARDCSDSRGWFCRPSAAGTRDSLFIRAFYKELPESDGLNFTGEAFTLMIGDLSWALPAGSFRDASRWFRNFSSSPTNIFRSRDRKLEVVFKTLSGKNRGLLEIKVHSSDLRSLSGNTATSVNLRLGNDAGQFNASFKQHNR